MTPQIQEQASSTNHGEDVDDHGNDNDNVTTTSSLEALAQRLIGQAREEAVAAAAAGNTSSDTTTTTNTTPLLPPPPSTVWSFVQRKLCPKKHPFELHKLCYDIVYQDVDDIKPAWMPPLSSSSSSSSSSSTGSSTSESGVSSVSVSNIERMMKRMGFQTYYDLYQWSSSNNIDTRNEFWMASQEQIGIVWDVPPTSAFSTSTNSNNNDNESRNNSNNVPSDQSYFPNGILNISDSCFSKRSPSDAAIVYSMESQPRAVQTMSFHQLDVLSNQIAFNLVTTLGLQPNDAVGICMPMTPESIAIYLGIIKAGCVVVSIADSFSSDEIATRCRLGQTKVVFTQDVIFRGQKFLPLFDRVLQAAQQLNTTDYGHDHDNNNNNSTSTDDGFSKESKDDNSPYDSSSSSSFKIVAIPGMLHATEYPNQSTTPTTATTTTTTTTMPTEATWTDRPHGVPVELHESVQRSMRPGHDISWYDLLDDNDDDDTTAATTTFESVKRSSMAPCNILFSSGTTGEPKAIVWSQSTPIKSAIDGYYHQDIQPGETIVWPTNIGWMMGPWLLFASFINGATIALFNGITSTEAFCEFVDEANVSMVGVVPSLVKSWKAKNATANCDWSKVRRFSSTGEASDPETYLWLMSRVPGYAPVIEYCGGTEIGGSFLSSTMVQPNVPSMFATPVLGSQIMLLDTNGTVLEECHFTSSSMDGSCSGELAIVPPSIGLSTTLLNGCHHTVYFQGMPCGPQGEILRRHGDEVECVRNSSHSNDNISTPYFRALGRCDDTMNIGGIKVGSVEIERVCNLVTGIQETAAIAVSGSKGGPSKLVMYAVLDAKDVSTTNVETDQIKKTMQQAIKTRLNPLFGISDVVLVDSLPRTASNKVMRRLLRDDYITMQSS